MGCLELLMMKHSLKLKKDLLIINVMPVIKLKNLTYFLAKSNVVSVVLQWLAILVNVEEVRTNTLPTDVEEGIDIKTVL